MNKIIIFFIVLLTNTIISQTKQEEKVFNFIQNSPLFKKNKEELFFLHTNKTVYFSGEKIWFAAYVFNEKDEKPSLTTRNLHINLYDNNFKLIAQKLYYVKNGKSQGQFQLPGDISTGNYYLELDTNWNRNFKKGTVTKIEIINLNLQSDESINPASISEKDIKTKNIKIKHEFLIHRGLDNSNSANFKIKTTNNIVKKYKGNTLFAVLHKNGNVRACASINILHKKSYVVKFNSNSFFNGANTITLFDQYHTIIAEKSFWNFATKTGSLSIQKKTRKKDTLYLELKLPSEISKSSISISMLDSKTELISNDDDNILKSFIDIDFDRIKKIKEKKKLDSFLKNRIMLSFYDSNKKNNPIIYSNEKGITLKGKVNFKKTINAGFKVAITSEENEIFLLDKLHKDMSFEFNNLYLKHPTKYKLTLLNKKGKIADANFYLYNNFYNYKTDSILKRRKKVFNNNGKKRTIHKNNILFKQEKDVVQLKEITITTFADKEKKIRKKHKNIIGLGFTDFYIPDDNLALGTDIFFYLNNIPGLIVKYPPLSSTPYIYNARGPSSLTGSQVVNVKLNGVSLMDDLLPLTGLLASDFEVILVNLSGAGQGIRGSNGVIDLIIRNDVDYLSKNKNRKKLEKETIKGFEKSLSKYSKPDIKFNSADIEKAYGTIDWIPNLKVDSTKPIILKIPVSKKQTAIKLIINGFDKNGILIHDNFTIPCN